MSMQLTIFEHSKTEKRCAQCKELRPVANFSKNKAKKDGLNLRCRRCAKLHYEKNKEHQSKYQKRHYEKNKEAFAQYNRVYYSENKESIKHSGKVYRDKNKQAISLRHKVYYNKNRASCIKYNNAYTRERIKSDPLFRLTRNLRTRIYKFCKSVSMQKNWSTIDAIGCNREEFKTHFESKFTEGMTWENYGVWHVDHIKPISLATTKQEAIQLSHYTNLQPLWAEDNLRKGNKYD